MLKPEFSGQFKRDYKLAIKRGCIHIQLNLVRQRGALNLNAPTVIPVLDERRIRVHQQVRKLALGRNLIYYRKTVALVATHWMRLHEASFLRRRLSVPLSWYM